MNSTDLQFLTLLNKSRDYVVSSDMKMITNAKLGEAINKSDRKLETLSSIL
jgi:hypothetical protein